MITRHRSSPPVPLILQLRHARAVRRLRNPVGRLGLTFAVLISLFAALGSLALTWAHINLTRDLPPLGTLPSLLSPPTGRLLTPTQVFDRTGTRLLMTFDNPAAAGRQIISYAEDGFPTEAILATLAVADPGFWQHPGFTLGSLTRSEPPTLVQRLIMELLLPEEPAGLRRDLREGLLALQLTAHFGREQILEWYLNSANYGRLAYGIDAAARVYFGKPATDLTLAEAAALAAILDSPAINPIDAALAHHENWQAVLQRLRDLGWINEDQFISASQTRLTTQPAAIWLSQPAPAFTQHALRQLAEQFGWQRLERGGLKITTTLDFELQAQVACGVQAQMARLAGSISATSNIPSLSGSACETARLLPLPGGDQDLIGTPAAEVLVIDQQTGHILALVSEAPSGLETALHPGRPPGTLLTPFVYLTAFTRGFSPASLVWDIPAQEGSLLAEVPDFDDVYQGPLRLRNALANDDLMPVAQTLLQIGSENAWRTTRQLGLVNLELASETDSHETLYQGGRVTLFEIMQAYATLANQGILVGLPDAGETPIGVPQLLPVAVLKVEDRAGNILLDQTASVSRPVITPQLAYLLTHTLSDETARWRTLGHPNPLEIGSPVAAKLGQTFDGMDSWSVGYTPQLAVGVWFGGLSEPDRALVNTAAGLWHAVMQYAIRSQTSTGWVIPPGITTLDVCDPSGLLPTSDCPNIVTEVFASGNVPIHFDTLYQILRVNRETGLLATVNTPPELVEEQVYLLVPPEAAQWAAQAGLPTPPEDYDLLLADTGTLTNLYFSSPPPFSYVSGQVLLKGTVGGDDFAYYRLRYGQGLNPASWIQIGTDQTTPPQDDDLGLWDTTGLNGLYVIQLLSVDDQQRVDTASLQLTVDNQPPEIAILFPLPDQEVRYSIGTPLTFRVEPVDNIGIARVDFNLNDRLLGTSRQPPYAYPWQARLGSHTLRIEVFDLAGNQSQLELQFSVVR
jgi:membrane peptidoglycan carboxypeptidase